MDNKPTYDELLQRLKELEKQHGVEVVQDSLPVALSAGEIIFKNAPFAISYLDPEMRIIKINSLMEELVGRKTGEVEGLHCYDVWGQYAEDNKRDGRERICDSCRVVKALKDGRVYTYKRRVAERYIEVTANPVRDNGGNIIGAMECGNDITERKRVENALRESEEKYRRFFTTVSNGWAYHKIVVDENDRPNDYIFIEVNKAFEKMTGLIEDDIIGKPVTEVLPGIENDPAAWIEKYGEVAQTGKSITFENYSEALLKWFSVSASCPEKGYFTVIFQDITEQKQMEEQLKKSEEKFRMVADFNNDWEYWIGSDDKLIYVSPSVERITGYTVDEFLKNDELLLKIIHPDDREHYSIHKHKKLKNDELEPLEFRIISRAGDERWINHICQNVYAEDGKCLGVRGSNRDITDLKKSEAAKAELQIKLMQARKMEAIATLAGGVAHDFNNALTSVIGNIELIKMDPTAHDIESCVQAVEESAYRMADLTKQLLAYARGGKYQVKEINLHQFIENVIDEIGWSVDGKIEVVSNLDCKESQIMADSGQLQMVFNAIITNAFEAIEDRGWIEISCKKQKLDKEFICSHPGSEYASYSCFSVRDNGCGMGEETLKRIFEPFYSTKFAGRGLGMAAVYGIVKNHDGYIVVESEPGNGTSVRVLLPLEVSSDIAEISETAAKKTILLIEDEEMLRDVEKKILEALGYHVLLACNGKESLRLVKDYSDTIDMALMDVHLPDISADILYMKLIEVCPTMKVLLCSGSALEWTAQKALNAGAEGFIQKPFSKNAFAYAVRKALDSA